MFPVIGTHSPSGAPVVKYRRRCRRSVLERGKVVLTPNWQLRHGRRSTDMNPCRLLRKAESGSGSDTLPRQPRECMPVEIERSVAEAGSGNRGDMAALVREPCNSGAEQAHRVYPWVVDKAIRPCKHNGRLV